MKTSEQKSATPGTNGPEAPHVPHFDKLRTMKSLQAATFSEDQAEAMVEAIDDAQRYLATKSDMLAMRSDMLAMKNDILTSMEKMELRLRADMEKREAGIRVDMHDLRAEMHAELKRLYWYIPVVVGVAVSLWGAIGVFVSISG